MGLRANRSPSTAPTIEEIAARPELARQLPPGARAAALARCAGALAALAAADLAAPVAGPVLGEDRLLDVAEVARRLDVSAGHVYRHAADWPFTVRRGRKLGFSAHGLAAWLRAVQQRALDGP